MEIITAYITKYALTQGIFEISFENTSHDGVIKDKDNQYYRGDEWHLTKESAIAKAEAMRLKKIASLKNQISKLEKMTFE